MIDSAKLLADLQAQQKKLEVDLREQIDNVASLKQSLESEYKAARDSRRTSDTFGEWAEGEITQAAVAWLLACVFLRFCEDNSLIAEPLLAGPGDANKRAKDCAREYFREHPTENDRHYLLHAFGELARYPAVAGLYDPKHNQLFRLPVSADAAARLMEFWQLVNPDTGELVRNFTDDELDTRFLGDLYQNLSESARKRYALLQTPLFVEEFILDRTLNPAIETFGLEQVRMIDPTCGSGHFLLGAFARINGLYDRQGVEPRERVKRALAAVYGVDLNPFAVAIARFRLLIAALKATSIRTLKEAPGWMFNVAAGDSLLHGRRFGELDLGGDQLAGRYAHCFFAEDRDEIDRILGQQYHAVVGNPPYITVKDRALNELYRDRYESCYRQYSLGVPFTERFIQLAIEAEGQAAGYVGLITANSFMKREFGGKLIESFLPRQDLTHVIDTSGAYIPGHGTPTVILFARHRRPVKDTVRAVLGIRGEPGTPADASLGLVWTSIIDLVDQPNRHNVFVSASNVSRKSLAKHPWSLSGGDAPAAMAQLETGKSETLSSCIDVIGFICMTRADDVYFVPHAALRRAGIEEENIILNVEGDRIRDWSISDPETTLFPYEEGTLRPIKEDRSHPVIRFLWPHRTGLWLRREPNGNHREIGLTWYEWSRFQRERFRAPFSLSFAFVATHNHFVFDRGGKVFNRSAPVIKLPVNADESIYLGLLGLLNSSTACFWMKQISHNKGSTVDGKGARQTTVEFENFYEFTGTGMQKFPLPQVRPLALSKKLNWLANERADYLPATLSKRFPLVREQLREASQCATRLSEQMIATQEELDWWCYHAYGLLEDNVCTTDALPQVKLGERAFEIVMARKMAAGELQTTWFERHGSMPIVELPAQWPADYKRCVERRMELVQSHPWIGLLEKPEYKRRWNQPSWEELELDAFRRWMLDRLESPSYWPDPALQTIDSIVDRAERDGDFMSVAALYEGQEGFALRPLLAKLLEDESVSALKVLRYKDSGLRKRIDWEHTWDLQRQEDAIDAEVAREMPQQPGETEDEWARRLQSEQEHRKREQIGLIAAPTKYATADFMNSTIKRLRGDLDVPKERFFTLPKGDAPGELLHGWAGWNHVQRVQAIAGTYTDAESRQGWPVPQLIPLLAAVNEELPWVLQWHNQIDPDLGLRLGDYFREWLGTELQKHRLSKDDLEQWRPARVTRARRAKASSASTTIEEG